MTRFEAKSELDSLEKVESATWEVLRNIEAAYTNDVARLEAERQAVKEQHDAHAATARKAWLPLHKRKQQLESFLSISG